MTFTRMEYFLLKNQRKHREAAVPQADGLLEQRRAGRKSVDLHLVKGPPTASFRLRNTRPRILNLSQTGAFIAGEPVRLNAELDLQFTLPNRPVPLQIKSRVVRVEVNPEDQQRMGMAVRFTAISGDDLRSLASFLEPKPTAQAFSDRLFTPTEVETWVDSNL